MSINQQNPPQWSKKVTETSHAMDLEENVFTWKNPRKIAQSILASAENSKRIKTTPYHSAMSMLNFYINRGGKNINKAQKQILEDAKNELKMLCHK